MSEQLAKLKAQLAARYGQPGYKENVKALEKEIARVSAVGTQKPLATDQK